ncbi:hypothetical protein BYT27DRAFT_7208970 [Phlegmacium glaucopus]|nr:hypothetical protein BYT27DRAFT_7208970 [Phlegmacium glaucopus]
MFYNRLLRNSRDDRNDPFGWQLPLRLATTTPPTGDYHFDWRLFGPTMDYNIWKAPTLANLVMRNNSRGLYGPILTGDDRSARWSKSKLLNYELVGHKNHTGFFSGLEATRSRDQKRARSIYSFLSRMLHLTNEELSPDAISCLMMSDTGLWKPKTRSLNHGYSMII